MSEEKFALLLFFYSCAVVGGILFTQGRAIRNIQQLNPENTKSRLNAIAEYDIIVGSAFFFFAAVIGAVLIIKHFFTA